MFARISPSWCVNMGGLQASILDFPPCAVKTRYLEGVWLNGCLAKCINWFFVWLNYLWIIFLFYFFYAMNYLLSRHPLNICRRPNVHGIFTTATPQITSRKVSVSLSLPTYCCFATASKTFSSRKADNWGSAREVDSTCFCRIPESCV